MSVNGAAAMVAKIMREPYSRAPGDAGSPRLSARFRSWLLEGLSTRTDQPPGPHTRATEGHQHPWWKAAPW